MLTGSTLVRPLLSEFVGSITADGQTTRVAAIALNTQGKAVLLNLVANDTTLSATTARFFKGEQLLFGVAEGMAWSAPNLFGRADQVSYRQIKAAIPNTREKNYLVIPHTADIGEGLTRPDALETPSPAPAAASTAVRPPRYIFANHDESAPNGRAFLGHLRALRVVFLPHWADVLWAEGLAAQLITPLPSLGSRRGRSRATRHAGSNSSAMPSARSASPVTRSPSPRRRPRTLGPQVNPPDHTTSPPTPGINRASPVGSRWPWPLIRKDDHGLRHA